MPLSEDEQSILDEIQAHFEKDDPKFARDVSKTTVYAHAGRQLKYAIAGIVVGLILMVVLLPINIFASLIAGFGVAFASSVWAYYAFRKMTQAGLNDLRRKTRGWQQGSAADRLKRHFGPDE